ncbi:type II pantothenate kinase [Bacillus sp. MRMR6]|uniref:type II pantothenate kinase n=1 Tax=Bacillus sp. MRMR6 TaxID=1928617 RepID=UPI000952EF53|nr:type II pantothenate kinase [Bacillus sp. MRMR6]OLS36857.1 type II pantothenate kinase [Bacillus sp. MRMR6]
MTMAGIDAGGSLIKVVYEEQDKMHYKIYQIDELNQVMAWLKVISLHKVALTGGKAEFIKQQYFPQAVVVPEFQATCEGALFFLKEKRVNPFLLVNIGTGTSWYVIKGEHYERVLGSGVGGGTFTGLGSLLATSSNYFKLSELAAKGIKGNVDLLVKDIYQSSEAPIDGELTAANFAKGTKVEQSEADRMASLSNMIAETITLLTLQTAGLHSIKDIVMIGSALTGNPSLKKGLEFYLNMVGLSFEFLANGEYCGAMGAYQSV